MVTLEMVTAFDGAIWNTRPTWLPSTARLPSPGPKMVRLFVKESSPLVSVIVAGVVTEKVIVSPLAARAMAARSEPGPLSAVFETVMVAACKLADALAINARHAAKAIVSGVSLVLIRVSFRRQ